MPLRIEIEVTKGGPRLVNVERNPGAEENSGYREKDGERTELAGTISSTMLRGTVPGLPLAAMEVPDL